MPSKLKVIILAILIPLTLHAKKTDCVDGLRQLADSPYWNEWLERFTRVDGKNFKSKWDKVIELKAQRDSQLEWLHRRGVDREHGRFRSGSDHGL